MFTKRNLAVLLTLSFVLFTGCQAATSPSEESGFPESPVHEDSQSQTFHMDSSSSEEPCTAVSGYSIESEPAPDPSEADDDIVSPHSSLPSAEQPLPISEPSESPPVENVKPTDSSSSEMPGPSSPPETSNPETPPHTDPPEPSVSSEPETAPEDKLIPGKQYHDPENDPYGVVVLIRKYAEERGFTLNKSLAIENSGYRGHPNVTDWTLEGVIEALKYHVDKLLEIEGPGYYNVVYRISQGKLEYYFLVR